jgi:putative DNA primase/helicase
VPPPTPGPHSDWDTRFREPQSTFPYQLTDLGNARFFADLYAEDLRYSPGLGWLIWDGTRWSRDELDSVVERAKEITDRLVQGAGSIRDVNTRLAVMAHALRSQSSRGIKAIVELAQSERHLAVASSAFDVDPWLLNCLNGTIDLRTSQLREHRREDLITKVAGCEYDPSALCPLWEGFLNRVFGSNQELIDFVQRTSGYALTGSTREQVLFLLHGKGENGKSTFLEAERGVLGGYSMQTDFTTFLERRSDGPRNDLARLKGSRMVTAVEPEAGRAIAESVVKQLSGGDTVAARFLYCEIFEFVPELKLFLAANNKPTIRGTDHGIWRRIRLIPFEVTIPPEERDRGLGEKLKAEWPGILAWMVRGCLAWQRDGLREPEAVLVATEKYRNEMDVMGDFLAARCVLSVTASISSGELYASYRLWCEDSGERVSSHRAFGMRLAEHGFSKKKSNGTMIWLGIGLGPVVGPESGGDGEGGAGQDDKPADGNRAGEDGEDGEDGRETTGGSAAGGVSPTPSPSSPSSPPAHHLGPVADDRDQHDDVGRGVALHGDQVGFPAIQMITQAEDLPVLAATISRMPVVALDIKTTGSDPILDRPRLVQLGLADGGVAVIDLSLTGGFGSLAEALKNAQILGHNLQSILASLQHHHGAQVAGAWDTMVAAKLLDGGENLHAKGFHTLAAVCRRYLGSNLPKSQQKSDWSGDLTRDQIACAARDVTVLPLLKDKLAAAMAKANLSQVASLEFAIVPVAVAMELAGVGVDRATWTALLEQRRIEAATLKDAASKALSVNNVDSPSQVLKAIRSLGIAASGTSAEALAPFRSRPEIQLLLHYRQSAGFVRGIGKAIIHALDLHLDGRVHAHFDPLAAPTGRFGCHNPNLLALPKEFAVRTAVVPSPGFQFVQADLAAIELRVLAQIANDPDLIKLFNANGDPHRITAAAMLGVDELQVRDEDRQRAKAVNFGFAFGMGEERFVKYALADYNVSFTPAEAGKFKAVYLQTYSGVARWQREMGVLMPVETRTASGRIRRFKNRRDGYCERLNTPVQGTAADGLKAALVLLHQRLPPLGARLVLCVHDEVLVEAPKDRAEEVKVVVENSMKEGMERFVTAVPIVVEADIRPTWAKPAEKK